MMKRFIFFVFTLLFVLSSLCVQAQDKFDIAERKIVRLAPNKFAELPKNIILALETRGCTVPQSYFYTQPNNVIYGEFEKKGQKDWAILCSKNSVSSILIFWNGSDKKIDEINVAPDKDQLYKMKDGKLVFTRLIEVADTNTLEGLKAYSDEPLPIDHEGIGDGVEYLMYYYYYQGEWSTLDRETGLE